MTCLLLALEPRPDEVGDTGRWLIRAVSLGVAYAIAAAIWKRADTPDDQKLPGTRN